MNTRWKLLPLGEICEIRPKKAEARENLSPSQLVSFVPMANLNECQKDLTLGEDRSLEEVIKGYTYFGENDVLLAKITPCFENGKLGIARGLTNQVGFGSSEFIVFRCSESIDPEYLFYFLSRDRFRAEGKLKMTGAVGHKRVNKEFIREYLVPLPKLNEQIEIVKVLNLLFEKINRLEEIEKLKAGLQKSKNFDHDPLLNQLRQSILQKAFAGELVDMKDEEPIPAIISVPTNDNHTDHAGVIAYADSYFRNAHAQSFKGKTTYEKVAQAAENIAGIDLGRQAIQWKRGPTDNQQRDAVEALAVKEGYFTFVSTGSKGFKLERGRKFNELRLAFEKKFQDQIPALDKFLRVIANLDTRDVEVLSTVHTAWNNYILSGQTPSDEQIVTASREGWHEEKEKIARNKFFTAIQTLREKDLVPTGQGKYVGKIAGQSFDF